MMEFLCVRMTDTKSNATSDRSVSLLYVWGRLCHKSGLDSRVILPTPSLAFISIQPMPDIYQHINQWQQFYISLVSSSLCLLLINILSALSSLTVWSKFHQLGAFCWSGLLSGHRSKLATHKSSEICDFSNVDWTHFCWSSYQNCPTLDPLRMKICLDGKGARRICQRKKKHELGGFVWVPRLVERHSCREIGLDQLVQKQIACCEPCSLY